jgi:cobalt/nickel transport system permease protein
MSLGDDLFSDGFARRDNLLQRQDSRVKLALTLGGMAVVLLSSGPLLPAMVAGLVFGVLIGLRIPLLLILRRCVPVAGIMAALVLLHVCMAGTHPLFAVRLHGWTLTFYREGLRMGATIALRVLSAFSLLLLLGFVTPAHELFRALRWYRMPRQWVEIAMMTYRYLFELLNDVADIATAQKTRLGYAGFRRSLSSTGMLMGSVLIRSLDQSVRTHEAMVARAYQDEMPLAPMDPLRPKALVTVLAGAVILVAALLICEGVLP